MNYPELLKINDGHPVLLGEGHLGLQQASRACGLGTNDLLRAAGNGELSLYILGAGIRGYLLLLSELELDDPELGEAGGYVIPNERQLPENAVPHISQSLLKISQMDLPSVSAAFLTGAETVDLVSFELPDRPLLVFVPNKLIGVTIELLEVVASEVELLRKTVATRIAPERLKEARSLHKAAHQVISVKEDTKAHKLLSTALEAYIENRVRQVVTKNGEITRIKNGCALLIELTGDVALEIINTDKLRHFRDKQLSLVPANENKVRLIYGTDSVASSMKKIEGTDWPIMSPSERNKRMHWISAWFRWLKLQGWITVDPTAALHGESVQTKAQRRELKAMGRADEARDLFTPSDLTRIFSAHWFKTGQGELTNQGTYRTFMPLYYWLPLLGLYTGGGRINELSQLHLKDISKTECGQWYVNFSEVCSDQTLKTAPSRRTVPIHPALIALGFDEWISALSKAGYARLFPELTHDSEKGYGKTSTKWFSAYLSSLGFPRDGKKVFHSFRHTYTNALPADIPHRISRQLTGHARGTDVHDNTYMKDVPPEIAAPYVERLAITLPWISPFNINAGLLAIRDALERKNGGRGAGEDMGNM